MSIIVEKFGGSSLAMINKINAVAKRVIQTKSEGHQMVVVISATGETTDNLIAKDTGIDIIVCESCKEKKGTLFSS